MKSRISFLLAYFLIIATFLMFAPTGRSPEAQEGAHDQTCDQIRFGPLMGQAWLDAMKANGCSCNR